MLTIVTLDNGIVELDTTQLDEELPIELYNEDEDGVQVDFDPVGDPDNAYFAINLADGSIVEGLWAAQSDDTIEDLTQLDSPM